jgi:hypothetical protein
MNDNRSVIAFAIVSISSHGLLCWYLSICAIYHELHTFFLAHAMYGTITSNMSKMYGIVRNLELSYNMTLMHIKSSSYLSHYPLKANIKGFETKLVERTQYSYVLFKVWC